MSRNDGQSNYGNLTALAESPLDPAVLYTGSDDGRVHVTRDGGASWTDVTGKVRGLPPFTYVTRIVASRGAAGSVYAVFDGHRNDDFDPYIFASDDFGESWEKITEGLPNTSLNALAQHPSAHNLLFAGSEVGVHFSFDGGANWHDLKNGLPTVPVDDIVVHPRDNDLVVGPRLGSAMGQSGRQGFPPGYGFVRAPLSGAARDLLHIPFSQVVAESTRPQSGRGGADPVPPGLVVRQRDADDHRWGRRSGARAEREPQRGAERGHLGPSAGRGRSRRRAHEPGPARTAGDLHRRVSRRGGHTGDQRRGAARSPGFHFAERSRSASGGHAGFVSAIGHGAGVPRAPRFHRGTAGRIETRCEPTEEGPRSWRRDDASGGP